MKSCCLIVTFNRKELLCKCIEKCLAQNINPDIYVFDNASTDGSESMLKEKGYFDNNRIIYFKSDVNGGGSLGFSHGLKSCIEMGYDFVWMLDDDGYPDDEACLEKCIVGYRKIGVGIVNAFVHDGNKLSFKLFGCHTIKEIEDKFGEEELLIGAVSPFNGTLVSKEVVSRIGYPKDNFFVAGDEAEYMKRAKRAGFSLLTMKSAGYFHPRRMEKVRKVPMLNLYVSQTSAWREYCRARNYMYIAKTYGGKRDVVKLCAKEIIKCMFQKEDRKRKLHATMTGLKDGYNNVFDRKKVFKYMKP